MKALKVFLFVFLILLFNLNYSYGFLEQKIENYTVYLSIGDTLSVRKSFNVLTTSQEPVVPGFAKLVLSDNLEPKNIFVSVGGSSKRIDSVEYFEGFPVIYYDIWRPISYEEPLEVVVSFDLFFDVKKGIFFNELFFDVGTFSVVDSDKINIILNFSKPNRISYVSHEIKNVIQKKNSTEYYFQFEDKEILKIEYTFLPLPVLPFKGYWIWVLFSLIPVLFFLFNLYDRLVKKTG